VDDVEVEEAAGLRKELLEVEERVRLDEDREVEDEAEDIEGEREIL